MYVLVDKRFYMPGMKLYDVTNSAETAKGKQLCVYASTQPMRVLNPPHDGKNERDSECRRPGGGRGLYHNMLQG